MLSGVTSHLVERSDCVNMLAKKYGYMPLKAVEFRYLDFEAYFDIRPKPDDRINKIWMT